MDRTSKTLVALLVAVSAGLVYEVGKESAPILIQAEAPKGAVELTGKEADDIAAAMLDAGVPDGGDVSCSCGLTLDGVWRDDLENCSDGKGAAFQRPCVGDSTLSLRDGKLLATGAILTAATK